MKLNNTFLTGFSLNVNRMHQNADFEQSLDQLDSFLSGAPEYNNIEVCRDYLMQDLGGETLDDILYEISKFSDPVYTEMLKELNHIIKKNKGYVDSAVALQAAGVGLAYNNEFISYYSQAKPIAVVPVELIVNDLEGLLELNCDNLGKYPISEKFFSDRAKLIFNNITYHKDFETTLSTVKSGDFKLYSIEFTRSLKALHNACPRLSNSGHNPPDLIIIREETGNAGRTMGCTVQGKNKEGLCDKNFIITDAKDKQHKLSNLNCEFHLKLDFDNYGNKLNYSLYNRAYFGLPLLEGKKYIALLHLGCHYD